MAYYLVSFSGENIFLNNNGEIGRYGFYKNIFISGDNEKTVMAKSKELLINKLVNMPEVEKESLEAINLVAEVMLIEQQDSNNAEQGFVWYLDNDLNS